MISGRSVLGSDPVPGRVVNQFSKLEAGSASMAAVSYSARSAPVVGACESCLTCSHEDVAVELTDVARMIFPALLFNALAGLMSGSALGARDLSFFVLAPP